MIIRFADFVKSSQSLDSCPDTRLPEYAFIGRSNVGKSSLINMLVSKPDLAKTSDRPGKTTAINHYLINRKWHLVDLPGYGFAVASKEGRQEWNNNISEYLKGRRNLAHLFVLIDSRIEPQDIDLDYVGELRESGIPFSIIYTKADKVSGGQIGRNIDLFNRAFQMSIWEIPEYFISSAKIALGRKEILEAIDEKNKEWN